MRSPLQMVWLGIWLLAAPAAAPVLERAWAQAPTPQLEHAAASPSGHGAPAPPPLQNLARTVAKRLARDAATAPHVLTVRLSGCALDAQACADFDAAMRLASQQTSRASLQTTSRAAAQQPAPHSQPIAEFIDAQRLQTALKERGLLTIDAYDETALQAVAASTGAEILLTEDLIWEGAAYRLHVKIVDAQSGRTTAKFQAKLNDAARPPTGQPVLLKDPETGAAYVLWNGDKHSAPQFKRPECDVCPQPPVPVQAYAQHLHGNITFLATIDEKGAPKDIVLVKSLNPTLDAQALRVLNNWLFKPALGTDGQPFAARIPIQITYNLNQP